MLRHSREQAEPECPEFHELVDLLWLGVADRENSMIWAEFLRRILPKINQFVRGSLRRIGYGPHLCDLSEYLCGQATDDLIQLIVLRLVEDECTLLKRFRGETDNDLLAYLAIISRSVVLSCRRGRNAVKRFGRNGRASPIRESGLLNSHSNPVSAFVERKVLATEVARLVERVLSDKTRFSDRDRLICRLHFAHDLSASQIANCRGIGLSKSGVAKVLSRVKTRTRSLAEIRGRNTHLFRPSTFVVGNSVTSLPCRT